MKKPLLAALMALACVLARPSPSLADNYVVKDGAGATQTFCSKVWSAAQYPCHLLYGLFGGVPTAVAVDGSGYVGVNVQSSALPSGAATAANQTSANTKLDQLHTDLSSSSSQLPATLGQKTSALSLAVVLPSDQTVNVAVPNGVKVLDSAGNAADFTTDDPVTCTTACLVDIGSNGSALALAEFSSTQRALTLSDGQKMFLQLDNRGNLYTVLCDSAGSTCVDTEADNASHAGSGTANKIPVTARNYVYDATNSTWLRALGDTTGLTYVSSRGVLTQGTVNDTSIAPNKGGCVYNSSKPSLSNTNVGEVQCNSRGIQMVELTGGGQTTPLNAIGDSATEDARAASSTRDSLKAEVSNTLYDPTNATWNFERGNFATAALLTLSSQAVGSVLGTAQTNLNGRCAIVTYTWTTIDASTNVTVTIQGRDPVAAQVWDILASVAETTANPATSKAMYVCPGVAATANVSTPLPLPYQWRVKAVVAGAGTVSGTVAVQVLN